MVPLPPRVALLGLSSWTRRLTSFLWLVQLIHILYLKKGLSWMFASFSPALFPTLAQRAGAEAPDPFVLNLQSGLMVASAVLAAVKLRLPDALSDEPQTVEELAEKTDAHAPTLLLLLRALASIEIGKEIDPEARTFVQTERSRSLCRQLEPGMADLVELWGAPYQWRSWWHLDYTVSTGRPALEVLWKMGVTIWDYLDREPQERTIFQRGLVANTSLILPAVLASYDFSAIRHLIDVGGGQGSLCLALLSRSPDLHATLFEQPAVLAQAQKQVRALPEQVAARYHLEEGDFFVAVPTGAECYVLKNVLMDWSDDQYVQILRRCREAMDPERGRLLVIEPVLGPDTPFTLFFSLQMAMLMHAAHHRSLEEHRTLFAQAGFELCHSVSLGLEQMLLEGRPVESEQEGGAA
jgi:hypothetical protein